MAPRETTELTAPHKAFATMCVVIALWLRSRLNFNSAYMDESDYLFVGRRLLSGETWPSKEYIFSSDLPLLALGFGESLGGLVGARSVSLILGIISLVLYLLFVRALNLGAGVAMLATALFAIASPHVNISKLATYDSMCLALFTGSAWLVAHILSSEEKGQRTARLALVASFLMALAILSKYVAALYAPIFGLALVRHHPIAGALPSAAILSGYCLTHREALKRLYEIQISGVHGPNSSSVELLATFGLYCGLPLLGGITSLWIGRGGSRGRCRARSESRYCSAPHRSWPTTSTLSTGSLFTSIWSLPSSSYCRWPHGVLWTQPPGLGDQSRRPQHSSPGRAPSPSLPSTSTNWVSSKRATQTPRGSKEPPSPA